MIGEAARKVALLFLEAHQRFLSPLLPPSCRYRPTCSEYAALAIARHGLLRGTALAIFRILRCNPWSRGGWEPVR